ncbi:GntR family transcriptional regulator [bacterium]|nr:GntR family transcriptional regulator [bacterium]
MKSETLIEKGYRNLKKAIISGEFCPGQSLPQRRIAERFGITTITAREIFRKLEHDGLIEIEPKWGVKICDLDIAELEGRYIVREALEGMAARIVAKKINSQKAEELIKLASEVDKKFESDRINQVNLIKLHYDLHMKIAIESGCRKLVENIERLNLQYMFWHNTVKVDNSWHKKNRNWHTRLVKSIIEGDPDKAEAMMRKHVRVGFKLEMSEFNLTKTSSPSVIDGKLTEESR